MDELDHVKYLAFEPISVVRRTMSGRNSQVARILSLLDLLEGASRALSVSELHEKIEGREHDCSKRTLYRDLQALVQGGFPLVQENGEEGETKSKWRLEKNTKIGQYLLLSARELFALFLARGVLTPLQGTPIYEDLQNIFNRIESKLGTKHNEHLKDLVSELHFEPGPQWGLGLVPEVLETVRAGCSENQAIECVYFSVNSQSETKRKLGPHYLYYARGGLYLVAEDFGDHKVKVFALPRMKSATLLDEEYKGTIVTPEEMFVGALNVYAGKEPKEITIEFETDIAHFVRERRWHYTQRIIALDGGKIRLQLDAGETPELISWVLGFGPSAKVITPESLAEKVSVQAMKTADNYRKKIV